MIFPARNPYKCVIEKMRTIKVKVRIYVAEYFREVWFSVEDYESKECLWISKNKKVNLERLFWRTGIWDLQKVYDIEGDWWERADQFASFEVPESRLREMIRKTTLRHDSKE